MKLSDEETRNLVGLPVKAGSSLSEQILIETLSEKHSTSPPKKQNGKFIVMEIGNGGCVKETSLKLPKYIYKAFLKGKTNSDQT